LPDSRNRRLIFGAVGTAKKSWRGEMPESGIN
jgi:hypothetical protein